MPLVNELLPFATAGGAGVMTQADYSALPSRLTGFITGIAEPTQVNKVWRQAAFTTAMIGQFTMNNSGFSTLDDGDVDTYEDHFLLAILNAASKGVPLWLVAGGTSDALTATVPAFFTALNDLHGIILDVVLPTGYNTVVAPTLTLTPQGGSAFAAKPIVRRNKAALLAGEIGGEAVIQMAFDSSIQQFRMLGRHGGASIVDPGTGALEQNRPIAIVAASSRSYNASDRGKVILRSNGGSSMSDTLPGGGSVMSAGWFTSIRNNNFTGSWGSLTLTPSGGALLDGYSTPKTIYPWGSTNIVCDGTNYWTINDTDINYFVFGVSNGGATAAMVWPGAGGWRMAVAWGAVSGMTPGLTAHVTYPITFQTSSCMITVGTVGASGPIEHTISGQTVSGFDIQNTNPTYSCAFHWHAFGMMP